MNLAPSPATRLIALLGDPVGHSLSPRFQNAAFRAAGVDGVYLALRCDAVSVPGLLRGIALSGGGGNVTVPHKEIAAGCLDLPTDAVRRTGACNTYWLEQGRVCGDNTDVVGVGAAVRRLLGSEPVGARVLVLGAGGAARSAVEALTMDGAGEVVLLNRSPERARELAQRAAGRGTRVRAADLHALAEERFDLAVNATSLGLRPSDPLPLAPGAVSVGAALDLVYAADGTAWTRAMQQAGVTAADGVEMLLHQGAAAFRRWWGREAPLDVMRAALPARAAAP